MTNLRNLDMFLGESEFRQCLKQVEFVADFHTCVSPMMLEHYRSQLPFDQRIMDVGQSRLHSDHIRELIERYSIQQHFKGFTFNTKKMLREIDEPPTRYVLIDPARDVQIVFSPESAGTDESKEQIHIHGSEGYTHNSFKDDKSHFKLFFHDSKHT